MSDITSKKEYLQEISDLAQNVKEEVFRTGNDISDVIHEIVDGHMWVLNSHYARQVLEHSSNDCAIFDLLGPQKWDDWSTAFSQSAYCAMQADLYEELGAWDPAEEEDASEEEEPLEASPNLKAEKHYCSACTFTEVAHKGDVCKWC